MGFAFNVEYMGNLLVRRKLWSRMAVFRLDVGLSHRISIPLISAHLHAKHALDRAMQSADNPADRLLVP